MAGLLTPLWPVSRVVAGLLTEPLGVTAGLLNARETFGRAPRRGQETRAEPVRRPAPNMAPTYEGGEFVERAEFC